MNTIPLLLYVAAGLAYGAHFATRHVAVGRAATTLLAAGALAHTFVIGMQTMAAGHVPVAGTTPAISTFVWLLALAYLYIEMTTDERAMGVFIVPLLVALQVIRAMQPGARAAGADPREPLFGVHVASLLFAYASFALACVIGVTYVLLFKEIKAKHLGFFYARLPSLQALDLMNRRAVTVGWVFLTVGVVVGVVWAAQARGGPTAIRASRRCRWRTRRSSALSSAGRVYSFALVARRARLGREARRVAVGASASRSCCSTSCRSATS